MRHLVSSLVAAAALGLAAMTTIAALGPSVMADAQGNPPVYAAQCWMNLEQRADGAVLYAHAAQGLSGDYTLTLDGVSYEGVFSGDGRHPASLGEFHLDAAPHARLTLTDETGRRLCDTTRYRVSAR